MFKDDCPGCPKLLKDDGPPLLKDDGPPLLKDNGPPTLGALYDPNDPLGFLPDDFKGNVKDFVRDAQKVARITKDIFDYKRLIDKNLAAVCSQYCYRVAGFP